MITKHAVSISLGDPSRDKSVVVRFKDTQIRIERIGTGSDPRRAYELFRDLDGKVDALSLGGMDYYVRLDGRDYPIHAAHRLISGVHKTPIVDGRLLKYALERQVFKLLAPYFSGTPHFHTALIPTCVDRIGLAEAVESVSDRLVICDFMFTLGIPLPVWGLRRFKRIAKILLPIIGFLPLSMIVPPGTKGAEYHPKHESFWKTADLIAGDMHYIITYSPKDLSGKTIITNTTTEENVLALRKRGVKRAFTITPVYEGRSFGVNAMEAALVAYAGKGRSLTIEELDALIIELDLRPSPIILEV